MRIRMDYALRVACVLGCMALVQGCETGSDGDDDGGDNTTPQVLVNPVVPEGEGRDEMVRWQNYTGEDTHGGRKTAIKWPNSLYVTYGCRQENTRCFVDGTEFFYYQLDVYSTGAKIISYGCATRADVEFPSPFLAVLYKDGKPFAACEFPDPLADNSLVRLPESITLPNWVYTAID
jgi:hypothetical protein